jgi:ATP/maltotriose-dependent transcriptional regulator MalT
VDQGLRARVLARLARALLYTREVERRASLCEQAVAIARRVGDPATLAAVLSDSHTATLGLEGSVRQLLATATEIVQLAEAAGDRIPALQGRALRSVDLLELGEAAAMRAEIETYERGARELRQSHLLWPALMLRANLAIIDGRFDEAGQLTDEALAMGRRAGDPAAITTHLGFHSVVGLVREPRSAGRRLPRDREARAGVRLAHLASTCTAASAPAASAPTTPTRRCGSPGSSERSGYASGWVGSDRLAATA